MSKALRILSVNVGLPRPLGCVRGQVVLSAIAKTPVGADEVFVAAAAIAGDGQADLAVHGGIDKAVYCYPADHWPWWEGEQALACLPATFGENLTLAGADETGVAIGDVFRWGESRLEVSQPRQPCFKLALHTGREDAPALMTVSGRCGWYFRVIQGGRAPVPGGVLEREHSSGGPSVREAFFAAMAPDAPPGSLGRVHRAPALAASWRRAVERRLASPED